MAYQKLTLEGFKQRLELNQYETAGAAYKAIGKSTLPDKEKAAAKELIEQTFKEAPKVVTTKRKYTRRTSVQTKPGKKEALKGTEEISRKVKAAAPLSLQKQQEKIGIARDRVETLAQALESLKEAKKLQPNLDIKADIQQARQGLAAIIADVQRDIARS